MRFDSVEPLLILGTSANLGAHQEEEEARGFLGKLFGKDKKDSLSVFEADIKRIGRDELIKEILDDDYILAYTVDKDRTDLYVVLTENYLILPDQDIICLADVFKYGLFNVLDPEFAQYAEDRINIPYDPTFVSEYEGEEGYELERFSLLFAYVDQYGNIFKYTIYMDVADRQDFYDYLSARLDGKVDLTSELVSEGKFEDVWHTNPFYKMTGNE